MNNTAPDREHTLADTGGEYSLLNSCQESGTYLMIFVNTRIQFQITEIETSSIVLRRSSFSEKRGVVAIRMAINKTTVCFIAAKFAGGFADDYNKPNEEYATISNNLKFTGPRDINDHDAVFWVGNLNYRIELAWDTVMDHIENAELKGREELQALYDNDQMVVNMLAETVFSHYREPCVRFPPTSTFQVGSDAYQVETIPAWTGRVLYKPFKTKPTAYDSVETIRISDQRPVYAVFELELDCQAKVLNKPPITKEGVSISSEKQAPVHLTDEVEKITFGEAYPTSQIPNTLTEPAKPYIRIEDWSENRELQRTHKFLHEMRDGKYWQDEKHRRRVRVAVLDSGVDMTHPEIAIRSERIVDTFCPIPGLEDQSTRDEYGRGTHVSLLLLQVAPMMDLYVARVFENAERVTGEYVGSAILHAVNKWQADVILMSFGFSSWVPSISQAIHIAAFKDIVMFSAASNEGSNADIDLAYPARETKVFDIRATDHLGNRSMYNPPWEACSRFTFATLGENVLSAWKGGQRLPKSGTSMAAAIAAGTAALSLDFSRLPVQRGHTPRHLKHVASIDGMRLLLEACSTKTPDNLLYIKPWLMFSKKRFDRGRISSYIDNVLDVHFG